MTWQAWVIGALAVAVLLLAGYAVSLHRRVHAAGSVDAAGPALPAHPLTPSRAPVGPVETGPAERPGPPEQVDDEGFVITRVGEADEEPWKVSDRVVLSATLGEPVVKVVALVHGVRRALSPANRNRIGFEVRQEVRRTRKVRRQEMRVAWREMKAREREQERAVRSQETVAGTAEGVEGAA